MHEGMQKTELWKFKCQATVTPEPHTIARNLLQLASLGRVPSTPAEATFSGQVGESASQPGFAVPVQVHVYTSSVRFSVLDALGRLQSDHIYSTLYP